MVDKVQNCAITVAILNYLNNEAIERDFNRQIREGFLDVSKPPTKEDIELYGAEMCNQVAVHQQSRISSAPNINPSTTWL